MALERSELVHHWVLDSGASFCMTSFSECFHTYKSWNGGVIYLDNNITCLVIRVKNIWIKIFDGIVQMVFNI